MSTRTLDLQALRIFKAVADEASVTRAATQLHCVQSNVTTRLKQLESELGVALFHRSGGRMVITPAGLTLSRYADQLLRLAQEARLSITSNGLPRGPLAIGSMETTAAARLPTLLANYHERYPDVDLTIETGPTAHLIQRVLEFKLDAALVGGEVQHELLESHQVFTEELVLLTDKAHARVSTPHDVADAMVLAFRSGCSYRRSLELWLASAGVVARRTAEFGTFEGIVGCVAAGMGITLMPRILVEQRGLHDSVVVHRLPRQYSRMKTMLIWRRDTTPLPARQAFIDVLQAKAALVVTSSRRKSRSH